MGRTRTYRAQGAGARLLAIAVVMAGVVISVAPSASASPTWALTRVTSTQYAEIDGLACTSTTHCALATSNGYVATTTSDWLTNAHWDLAHGTHVADQMSAVVCPTANHCIAVGGSSSTLGVVIHTTNGGTTWPAQHLGATVYPLWAISCSNATTCVAAGDRNGHTAFWSRTTNAGASWTDHVGISPSIGVLASISCPTSTFCVVFDSTGHVAQTTTAGAKWAVGHVPSSVRYVTGLWCAASQTCFATGSTTSAKGIVLKSTNGGLNWTSVTPPGSGKTLNAISCTSISFCVAVGATGTTDLNGHAVIDVTTNGTTWHTAAAPGATSSLRAVVCRSTTWCAAGGTMASGAGNLLTYS